MGIGSIATTGMNAAMSDMQAVGNNIANANTCGFKEESASFEDIFQATGGRTQIGSGVRLANVSQNFQPGSSITDGINSHMSIVSGDSFFMLRDQESGQTVYSRNGQFSFDPLQGYFMLGNQRLQGFPGSNATIATGSVPKDLFINTSSIPAVPSSKITQAEVNLSSNDTVPTNSTFSVSDSNSYNFSSPTIAYDSLGNPNPLTLYYVKNSTANSWSVYTAVGSTVLNSSAPATLTFNADGSLQSETGLSSISFSPTSGATSPQTLSISMAGCTQNAGIDNPGQFTSDGIAPGQYSNYTIDGDGKVKVFYSNGQSSLAGQVALANFSSPETLQYLGNGQWSDPSGKAPIIKPANSIGNIQAGSHENSNVDIASQLVDLINSQSVFQANAQVEQVNNQVMQTVTKL